MYRESFLTPQDVCLAHLIDESRCGGHDRLAAAICSPWFTIAQRFGSFGGTIYSPKKTRLIHSPDRCTLRRE